MLTAAEVADWANLEGVASSVAAARDSVDALLRDRGLRRTTPELTTESLLRGAAASALLETGTDEAGADTSLHDAVERLHTGAGDPTALRAARLYSGLLTLVPVVTRSPLQAFARMHVLAASGEVADEELGRPRPEPATAMRLQQLAEVLVADTTVPAIVVAAVAHAEVATTRPFASGNGMIARALERLLLVTRGVDPTSMVVPEAGHLRLEPSYRAALDGYASGTAVGRRAWLLHVCSALPEGVSASPLR